MSKLYFATEARFVKKDGKYYSLGGFSKSLWRRYLDHFDEMTVIARVTTDRSIEVDESMDASCERVTYMELPYYVGFQGYLHNRHRIKTILSNKLRNDGHYICRVPGQIGGEVISILLNKHIPYACEIVGNPWDVFAKGSINHPLRPLIRRIATYNLKNQVKQAAACLYVTQHTLQDMYPTKEGAFAIGVSDVIVKDDMFSDSPKIMEEKDIYELISVGSLEQMYKAPDIVLKSISILKGKGIRIHLTWLGDGAFKHNMEELAKELEIEAEFKGNVPAETVHHCLSKSDIFTLVSRTEGLPRAVVEAMAHGLPCIGSRVGGIPELLEASALVDKENPEQVASLIEKMVRDVKFANWQAKINLENATKNFREDNLAMKRNSFFEYIKSL